MVARSNVGQRLLSEKRKQTRGLYTGKGGTGKVPLDEYVAFFDGGPAN